MKGKVFDQGLTRDQYKKFRAPPSWYKWKVGAHFIVLVGGLVLAYYGNLPLAILGTVITASQIIVVYTGLHGASHGHLSGNKRLNAQLGVILGMILGTSFHGYRITHMRHHQFLRKKEDTQDVIHDAHDNRYLLGFLLIMASVIGAAFLIWVRVPSCGIKYASAKVVILELLLAVGFYTVMILILPGVVLLHLLAAVILALVWGSLLDITYHQGLPTSGGLESSRSFDCDGFGFWFLNGENRHAEHHAYPAIPGPNLAEFSTIVKPELKAKGAVYEPGYIVTFFRILIKSPLFLPPKIDPPKDRESISPKDRESISQS